MANKNTSQAHSWLYRQLFANWKKFEIVYVSLLLLLQLVVFAIAPDSIIGMIAGVFGVIALVYGMKGRKVNFIFGLIQTLMMTLIAFQTHSWMSFVMGIFYVVSQPIGWVLWGKDDATKKLTTNMRNLVFAGAAAAWLIVWGVDASLKGQLPYLDSLNLIIPLIAQVLYVLKYQDNWPLWIIVNIAAVIYWSFLVVQFITGKNTQGNLGMYLSQVALQAALLFNSLYANIVWRKGEANGQ